MHTLKRNRTRFHYALYEGIEDVINEDGEITGEKALQFGDITEMRAYITPKAKNTQIEPYGVEHNYTRRIITDDMNCPITEQSQIWIDEPITKPYDYIVKKVSKSLNHIIIEVKAVKVDEPYGD